MKRFCFLICSLTITAAGSIASNAFAQESANNDIKINNDEIHFFFGVRPWATTWDVPLVDSSVELQGGTPVIRQHEVRATPGTRILPIFSTGVKYKDFVIGANVTPSTSYSSSGLTDQPLKREEWDITLGYAVTPNILASLVYKTGKINQTLTRNTQALLNTPGSYKVDGLGFGINVNAPLQDKWSLYGSFAMGQINGKASYLDGAGHNKHDGSYRISEVGLAYRLYNQPESNMPGLKNVSLQIGYRSQNIIYKDVGFATSNATPPYSLISNEMHDLNSTTQGFVIGLIGSF